MTFLRRWLLAAVLLPALAVAQAPEIGALAVLELRDQYGNPDSLAAHRGAPVVAVIVTVNRLSMIERWERDLSGHIPGVQFLNVTDLPPDVAVDLERTAATLRKRVPAGVRVLMDPTRQWATVLGLNTDVPNLLVFDASGQLRQRYRGRWTAALGTEVAAAVAPLINAPLVAAPQVTVP